MFNVAVKFKILCLSLSTYLVFCACFAWVNLLLMWLCWLVQINTYSKSHSVKSSGNKTEREIKSFKTEYEMINKCTAKSLMWIYPWNKYMWRKSEFMCKFLCEFPMKSCFHMNSTYISHTNFTINWNYVKFTWKFYVKWDSCEFHIRQFCLCRTPLKD